MMSNDGCIVKPSIPDGFIKEVLQRVYGLKMLSAKELDGYESSNHAIAVESDFENVHIREVYHHGYILKIFNAVESKKTKKHEVEQLFMKYLGDKGFPVQSWVPDRNGQTICHVEIFNNGETQQHILRLLTYLPGICLLEYPISCNMLYDLGKFVARLSNALQDFEQDIYSLEEGKWSLGKVPVLRDYLHLLEDTHQRQIVTEIIEAFEKTIDTSTFPKGYVHGDVNDTNLLLLQKNGENEEYAISGLIDFEDICCSCPVYDLCINITYLMIAAKICIDQLDVPGHVLTGYLTERNLISSELNALRILVAGRICQSLVYGLDAYKKDPSNTYLIHTAEQGWSVLYSFWAESEDTFRCRWRKTFSGTL